MKERLVKEKLPIEEPLRSALYKHLARWLVLIEMLEKGNKLNKFDEDLCMKMLEKIEMLESEKRIVIKLWDEI